VVSKTEQKPAVSANSVLHLKMNQPVPELMDNIETASFELNPNRTLGLHDIIDAIEKAKEDDKIKGIFLEPEMPTASFTSLRSIRAALLDFRESGKFIYSYAPFYIQSGYYLASAGDKITLAPLGIVDWRGFSAQYPFYEDMLTRIGVNFEVFYAGRYKSASEPYRRNSMSKESKEQTRAFLEEMYRIMLEDVSTSRQLSTADLDNMANTYAGINPELALSGGLVDQIVYREELLLQMREQLGIASDDDINFVKLADYYDPTLKNDRNSSNQIALLMAEGVIVDGKGKIAEVGDKTYVKLIQELQEDDDVKAIVLRVNSPGGSAMASDHIWQALMNLKTSGKPLVVSMGSVAASGGYYIAAPADHIIAEPSTITGSIGVVSAIPQFQDLLKQKLGVHFDSVQTGPFATGFNPVFDMSEAEKALLRSRTDQMYETFLSRVSTGRGMPVAEVDSVAQGRVWVGTDAYRIGLVDQLGNLDDAITKAASLAELEDYTTAAYPTPVHPWERLVNDLLEPKEALQEMALKEQLGTFYPYYCYMKQMADGKGMQMRLPFMMSN
jgi:protease-4